MFAVEERNKIGYVQNNKVANTIEMYQLYGAVVVMTLCVFCNSFKQQILIEACKYLQEIDKRILQNNRNAIDYVRTRNYILCKHQAKGEQHFEIAIVFFLQLIAYERFSYVSVCVPV